MIIRVLISALLLTSVFSCRQVPEQKNLHEPGKKEMADLNRYLVQKDRERIENYIERRDLKMTESQTGLWYQIRSEGSGNYLTDSERIVMEYNCSLLDGTICYSSGESGPKEVVIGKSEMAAGLNEGLKMLKPGGEAVFIIPPFLAYGLKGDGNKIPARSIIVYEIKIMNKK
jgi:FKBP-type peptidyl-prolyl cis-trans isomerase